MNNNPTEDDLIARIRSGLRDAIKGQNLNWTYGTKVQKQKYVDIALNHFVGPILTEEGECSPITRSWYKYGCVQTSSMSRTPFTAGEETQGERTRTDIQPSPSEDEEPEFEASFEPREELLVPESGDSVPPAQHPIADRQSTEFAEFFIENELSPPLDEEHWANMSDLEFLELYYTNNAPSEVQDLYLANLTLRQTLTDAHQVAQDIDENRAELLTGESRIDVDWTPESYARGAGKAAVKLRLAIRQNPIVPDALVDPVMEFTDLVEDSLLGLTDLAATDIRPRHYRVIKQIDEFLDEVLWEWIARYISYATVVGPQAASWREASRRRIVMFAQKCPKRIDSLRTDLHEQGLLPGMSEYDTSNSGTSPAEQFMSVFDDTVIRNQAGDSASGDDDE